MPARNAERFIRESVTSTLAALPTDAEMVVFDDGSTDKTLSILNTIDDQRLRIYSRPESLGVVHTANELLSITDSEYVARIDADDLCSRRRFVKQLEVIKSCDFAFSRISYIDENGSKNGSEKFPPINSESAPLHLSLGNIFSNPTMFARRSAMNDLGGYRETASEDYDLWMRAAISGLRLRKTYIPLVNYRLHPNQMTADKSWQAKTVDSKLLHSYGLLLENELGLTPVFNSDMPPLISAPFLMLESSSREEFNIAFRAKLKDIPSRNAIMLLARKRMLERIYASVS